MGTVQDGTPDGPKLHSVIFDPRDPKHMCIAMSGGGVHETRNGGATWSLLIDGLAVVEGFNFDINDPTFHDPHCIRMCPSNPDRLYKQNQCGIYRLDRPSRTWIRIGSNMPKSVGDIGLPMAVHPRDDKTVYVFPMDGLGVWPRTIPAGRPAAFASRNAGGSRQRLDAGLPKMQAWWTIKRQAFCTDAADPVGVYVGNTGGELCRLRSPMPVKVLIASPLRSYTEASEVTVEGTTVAEALADLDRRYPGIRFRMVDEQDCMRRHMRLFVDGEQVFDVSRKLKPGESIRTVRALSGG